MILKTLIENTAISNDFACEHGLCLYIQTKKHKLLFDLGQSDLFAQNAKKLDVDLEDIDTVIISHGHIDHGGGLRAFLSINHKATIYIHQNAFGKHYALRAENAYEHIGLDKALKDNERLIYTFGHVKIDDELELISGMTGDDFMANINDNLFKKNSNTMIADFFDHEQSLIITQEETFYLVAGCAHRGITNIGSYATGLKGKPMEAIIGGFHLQNLGRRTEQTLKMLSNIADKLNKSGSKYFTCHCTGLDTYNTFRAVLDEKIQYLSAGSALHI